MKIKKILSVAVLSLFTLAMTSDVFAKSYSSSRSGGWGKSYSSSKSSSSGWGWGSSKSSSSSSSSSNKSYSTSTKTQTKAKPTTATNYSSKSSGGWGSSKATSVSASKPSQAQLTQMKQNSIQKKTNADANNFKKMDTKSASYTKADQELTKSIGKSGKTYRTRTEAKNAMTEKMASKTYDYKDPKVAMTNKPSYIPPSYSSGGHTYTTVYVGGHYGYRNSLGDFVAYTAANMLVTDMMLHSYGYRPVYQEPVRVVQSVATSGSGMSTFSVVMFSILMLFFIVGIGFLLCKKM